MPEKSRLSRRPFDIRSQIDQLATVLLREYSFAGVLELVVSLAVEAIPGVDTGSITLAGNGRPETPAATSGEVRAIDEVQYTSGRGPCLSAISRRKAVVGKFSDHEAEWPEVAHEAQSRNFQSVLSLPLGEPRIVGALNLYAVARDGIDEMDLAIGKAFAHYAGALVSNAATLASAEMLNRHLEDALVSRDVIGQAKGVLRERHGYSDQEAFDTLRHSSQRERTKLREIAQDVLASTQSNAVGLEW